MQVSVFVDRKRFPKILNGIDVLFYKKNVTLWISLYIIIIKDMMFHEYLKRYS